MPCTVSVQGIFCFSEEKPQKSAAAEPEPKLGERRPDMLFDGLDADVEPLGDLPVFRPVVRLNRNTRRHCSESPEMQQSISSLNCDNWNSSSIWSATSVRIQTSNSSSPDSPPPPFFGAQQIYGTVLHGDKQQRQQRPVEVHLLPPFPQGKKDILHDVFRRLAVMDHLKSPCTQGFIVIAE